MPSTVLREEASRPRRSSGRKRRPSPSPLADHRPGRVEAAVGGEADVLEGGGRVGRDELDRPARAEARVGRGVRPIHRERASADGRRSAEGPGARLPVARQRAAGELRPRRGIEDDLAIADEGDRGIRIRRAEPEVGRGLIRRARRRREESSRRGRNRLGRAVGVRVDRGHAVVVRGPRREPAQGQAVRQDERCARYVERERSRRGSVVHA